MTKAALYLRVSTDEQHPENQLPDLERYAKQRGWEVFDRFVDHGVSGAKDSRPELDRMMSAARRRRFDVVVAWSVSRLGRSMVNNVMAMHELSSLGVGLVFVTQGIDTTTPIGRGVMGLLSALAEAEREELRARTRAGMARARVEGKMLGRPRVKLPPAEVLHHELMAGASRRALAKKYSVGAATIRRRLAQPMGDKP